MPTVLDAAIDELGPDHVRYAQGCGLLDDDRSGIGEATALARESDVAVAGLLSGRVRPTGRLPVQIPRHPWASGTYLQPALGGFNPGISTLDARPLYPFGYGLTDGAIVYEAIEAPDEVVVDGTAEVDVTVRNGGRETVEVVQLYASFPTSPVVRPTVQLVGFARPRGGSARSVWRPPGEGAARLAATGVDGLLALESGDVVLSSGPSAADLPLTAPGPDDPDGCGQWQVRGRGTARKHDVTRLEREEAVHAGRGQTRGLEAEAHGPCGARRERESREPYELDGRPHHG